jgi:hypothetical protein
MRAKTGQTGSGSVSAPSFEKSKAPPTTRTNLLNNQERRTKHQEPKHPAFPPHSRFATFARARQTTRFPFLRPGGGIGRRDGLRIHWPRGLAGSNPVPGISFTIMDLTRIYCLIFSCDQNVPYTVSYTALPFLFVNLVFGCLRLNFRLG